MSPCVRGWDIATWFIRRVILAPTVIGFTIYHLASWFDLAYKPLLVLSGVIVGIPVKVSLGARYAGWRRTYKARKLAAVTASESRGKLLCDIDFLRELQRENKSGFIGEFILLVCKSHITSLNTTLFVW